MQEASGLPGAMAFNTMPLKRPHPEGRAEDLPPPQPPALTPDMIAAAANNMNKAPLAHMFPSGHLPPYSH